MCVHVCVYIYFFDALTCTHLTPKRAQVALTSKSFCDEMFSSNVFAAICTGFVVSHFCFFTFNFYAAILLLQAFL